tara:strand:+ start:1196 stop:2656 length:1461 start_codon:yes stop_codon:yes gene_type:complete
MKIVLSKTTISKTKSKMLVSGMFKNKNLNNVLDKAFDKNISKAIKLDGFKADFNKKINLYGNAKLNRLSLIGLGNKKDFTSDKLRALFANVIRDVLNKKIDSFDIDAISFGLNNKDKAQACSEGLVLGAYSFNDYKSNKNKIKLKQINIVGDCDYDSLRKGQIIAEGVNFSRDLGNHPPNILTPTYLATESKKISKSKNMSFKVFDIKDFKKMGMGSFYGVAMGAKEPAKMIIVEYKGGKKTDKPLALVGKGLTFDSGGISIKPSPRMDEMKFDMCGGATVLGIMKAVSKLQPKLNIIFAVGATENMPGSMAQRPGDIVKAYNGKTIEVLNTDAEGRLVLADVLSYVNEKYEPNAIIDFATLTGAVLIALGDRASGIMGNNNNLIKQIQNSSEATGERVWQLPLWDEYCKDIKSQIADIKNLGRGRLAGTISAGAFLKEFVSDTPWVHMDIAGTAWGPKEPSYMPKNGATGVAVRLIYNLIESKVK